MAQDFCFVHAADLHLGGRRWLRSEPTDRGLAERVAYADRLALAALVDLCLEERAALLICAGDIFDGWCRSHRADLVFVHELLRLRDVRCRVVILLGNHDARCRVARALLLPEHAVVLGRGAPGTLILDELGVALHGWSLPKPCGPVDVAASYPAPVPGLFNIGVLHTSAEGRRGHANYAPCSRRTLRRHGYDYWALGHVHEREVVATEPWIVFPGNLQARGCREAGPKGATVVRVLDGSVNRVEHRALDAVRFATVVASTSHAGHLDDVIQIARGSVLDAADQAGARPLIVRLVLEGAAGAACVLAQPDWKRSRAFEQLKRGLAGTRIWLDETWMDSGLGSWLVTGER